MRILIFALASVALLVGCGSRPSVSQNQCTAGDWETIGYRDGVQGLRSSRLLDHQDACVEHGITPSRSQYMVGWEAGVREYCEPSNAYYAGERGRAHNNVCPADMRGAFLAAYEEGWTLYRARTDVANLEWEIDQKVARKSAVKSEIISATAAQLDGTLTTTQRVELATRVQRLYEEQSRLDKEIPDLEAELVIKRRELDRLTASMASATPVARRR
ncbi:MAG: DUF2799 domain-containing protein [Pseudomonadales bacterium]